MTIADGLDRKAPSLPLVSGIGGENKNMVNCSICKRELEQPNDPTTLDCGGDCLLCMAECGDPDAIALIRNMRPAEQGLANISIIRSALRHALQFAPNDPLIRHALEVSTSDLVRVFAAGFMRYKDRPTGFVEARKTVCTSPDICFEFGDKLPICGPCDIKAVRICMGLEK